MQTAHAGASRETVLYAFLGSPDGSVADSGVVFGATRQLYGTTPYGGGQNSGTLFKLAPRGTSYSERIIYSFQGSGGRYPTGGLLRKGGVLLGTTLTGGDFDSGTVFMLTLPGGQHHERVLYSFGALPLRPA